MLVPSLGMGGMERVCVNYANLLCAHGYEVYVYNLTFDEELIVSDFSQKVVYKKNILEKVPSIRRATIKDILKGNFRIRNFKEWVKHGNPSKIYRKLITEDETAFDIEIAFYGGNLMKILMGSCQKQSLKLGWIHASTIESHFHLFKDCDEAIETYKKMDVLMCVSETVKEKAIDLFSEDVKAEVIYNPQDVKKIRALSQETIDDVQKKKYTFINASRIDINHKGFDRLLRAVSRLNEEKIDFDVWILGNGKDESAFKQMISKSKVDNIHLLGEKTNPYKYMKKADCYICSSRFEGFSMVVAEAILLGLPVISTDISGAREMLGNSEFGLIVENSEDGIYQGMKNLLSNQEMQSWIKKQALKHMDFLSEEVIYERFKEIINKYSE